MSAPRTVAAASLGVALLLTGACDGVIADPPGGDGLDREGRPSPGATDDGVDDPALPTFGPAVGRRMTREEYVNSLEVVVGVDVDADAYDLPRDNRVPEGFRNSASDLLLSPGRVRAYDAIAADVVERMDWGAVLDAHAECTEATATCRESFVRSVGLSILRRPPPDTEVASYASLFDVAVEEGEGFGAGARLVVYAMLQSPRFLYRLERQAPDGSGDAIRRVDDFELATRLSFLVWNAAPDAELIALASTGELGRDIEGQVRRMLEHPRARRALRQYAEQWLYLDAILEGYELGEDMKEETYRLFEWLVWEQDADLMRLFTERRTELTPALAEHYGLPASGSGVDVYEQPPERLGLLTHASVLTARTINPSSSMIDRGLFVLNDLFCDSVPPPEGEALRAAIEEQAVPETSGLSQRERFAMQSEDPLCAGCHGKFDPLGLAFETFGPTGRYITEDEHGNELTGSGSVQLGDVDTDYRDIVELSQALSRSDTVARCVVEKVVQHAYGRRMRPADDDFLDAVYDRFTEDGRSYRELLVAIATHPEFSNVEVME